MTKSVLHLETTADGIQWVGGGGGAKDGGLSRGKSGDLTNDFNFKIFDFNLVLKIQKK